ncbi:N-acetyltransferase 9 isoform X2 [Trichoplusia ni]|uniref:N-acetyltransferase 9 isoform X2 n=1 Tax=Trichoplusia ni TaxID=7111 RepID=A0A7E5VDH8_TRINI|nr:N-acetyltransferase 9 isoform X2 [Trichoplusia ni]
MKLNSNTKIVGRNVILVPYREYHVPRYHEWMKSEDLQKLTASEPLTLEEEYDMQKSWCEDDDNAMIGDTNIFMTDNEITAGEIEIMIAEEAARGKKMGWEAVILMLLYGIKHLNLKTIEAKISLTNIISIKMFNKLGFEEKSTSEIFQEVTLEKNVCSEWVKWLNEQAQYELQTC